MKTSAGILLYRKKEPQIEYFLVRPGGPFYKNLEDGIWTIPKGLIDENEDILEAARREFEEEVGVELDIDLNFLNTVKLSKGKSVIAFYAEYNLELEYVKSNHFKMEYPKHSGKQQQFPEIEKGEWLMFDDAKVKIHPKLLPLLVQLEERFG